MPVAQNGRGNLHANACKEDLPFSFTNQATTWMRYDEEGAPERGVLNVRRVRSAPSEEVARHVVAWFYPIELTNE